MSRSSLPFLEKLWTPKLKFRFKDIRTKLLRFHFITYYTAKRSFGTYWIKLWKKFRYGLKRDHTGIFDMNIVEECSVVNEGNCDGCSQAAVCVGRNCAFRVEDHSDAQAGGPHGN